MIFQNLQGAVGDVQLRFNEDGWASVHNAAFQTEPVVIHGNGLSKVSPSYKLDKLLEFKYFSLDRFSVVKLFLFNLFFEYY